MTDPILSAIDRQPTACTLLALRSIMRAHSRWSGTIHGPAYRAKFEELCGRWRG